MMKTQPNDGEDFADLLEAFTGYAFSVNSVTLISMNSDDGGTSLTYTVALAKYKLSIRTYKENKDWNHFRIDGPLVAAVFSGTFEELGDNGMRILSQLQYKCKVTFEYSQPIANVTIPDSEKCRGEAIDIIKKNKERLFGGPIRIDNPTGWSVCDETLQYIDCGVGKFFAINKDKKEIYRFTISEFDKILMDMTGFKSVDIFDMIM